jgi:hypothetical protein
MTTRFTQQMVDQLIEPGRYRDTNAVRGLYPVVRGSGAKSWIMRYTLRGCERTLEIGSTDDVTLLEAREAVRSARQLLWHGTDPVQAERIAAAKRADEAFAAKVAKKLLAEDRKRAAPKNCFVYLIKAGSAYFKLGISRNVQSRTNDLQTANPLPLSIAATRGPMDKEDAQRVERSAHLFLKPYRTNGERFACSMEVAAAAIDKAMAQYPVAGD